MRKLLIVVDYQKDFVDGTLGFPKAAEIEQNIIEKIKEYRQNNNEVLFTFDTHNENYMDTQEGRNLPVIHCQSNSKGHELFGQVADCIEESDKKFYKNQFGSDEMYEYLNNNLFESIEIVGLISNICIIFAAVLAKTAQPETPIIVDAKCTASFDDDLNNASLNVMSSFQVSILNI